MGRYLSLLVLPLAAILQSTVVPLVRVAGGGPDLVLLLVLSWTLLSGPEEGALWAVVGGISQDLLMGFPTGTTALALVVAVGLASVALRQVAPGNLILPPLAGIAATGAYHVTLIVLFTFIGRSVGIGYTLVYVTLPSMLFNALLILPIFRTLGWLGKRYGQRRVSL